MKKFALLPRVRVNYNFKDLWHALWVSEKKTEKRKACEKFFSDFYDGEPVILTPSARDAIYEVLIRLPQETVIVPAYTCIAVVEAVLLAGKKIVYARNNKVGFNSGYLECIVPDTIVLATHQYGLPCNIEEIAAKCQEVGAVLIEDCATSMGTIVHGKKTGKFGDYAVVSFNASKLLNVPPYGGVLIGKNKQMLDIISNTADWKEGGTVFKIKSLVRGLAFVITKNKYAYRCFHYLTMESRGKHQKTEHEKPASNRTGLYMYKFSEWQAGILLRQLRNINDIIDKRKEMYSFYDKKLNNSLIIKPHTDNESVCCRYAILVKSRDRFYKECIDRGIDMDFSHCSLGCPSDFEEEHEMANQILNLPFYDRITERELSAVVKVVNSIK